MRPLGDAGGSLGGGKEGSHGHGLFRQAASSVHWGIVKTRTWMTKTIEADAQESNRPLYGPKHAEAMINEVFRDALDKLLKDEATLKGIFLGSK